MGRTEPKVLNMSGAKAMESDKLDRNPGSGTAEDGASTKDQPAHLNGCVPLSHQVAGHKFGVDKVGILQHPDGTVLKQVQPPPRGPREMQFYRTVFAEDCSDPCLLDLQNHLPKYYGTWSSPDSPTELYLKLEDVTSRFNRPCIMDVKLGQRSYDPFASQEKREQQIRKYPLMEEIGFLILGMRVYDARRATFDSYNQHYGRGLAKDTIRDGLARFFHNGLCLRKDAIRASISRLQQILHWFHSQNQLVFYASSLLFVYEGLPSSFLSRPPVTDAMMKTANLLLVGDGGKAIQEEAGLENKKEEFNNNTAVAVSWDGGLSTNHRTDPCGLRALLHISRAEEMAASVDRPPVLNDQNRPANGNSNEEEDEEGRSGTGGQGSAGDPEVEVRMIDFAHVFPSDSQDQGYIYGLKHLLTVLEQILCGAAQNS
ncbi:PREDICTED: inositol polyphosphate multikinase isoform X2 [Cyprinodon variegatus]|uniref:Kinase n=1 Tax=Cyprinodon variegatus TaxID=28743 RepID=A0A3Q2DXZ3_CYPVA|nr:PREDICTED: inositol polyphosphate multikinase isoform X2 [Cyprinodon variegatus]